MHPSCYYKEISKTLLQKQISLHTMIADTNHKIQYSIRDLEKISGVKAHTIRIWEKRYKLLQPERTDTNIRFYNDDDLRKLLNVASLLKSGMKISRIAQLCAESIRKEILKTEQQHPRFDQLIDRLIRTMMDLDTMGMETHIDEIIAHYGIETAMSQVFFPFLEKVGILWQVGSVVPTHEHFVSALLRQKLISATDRLPQGKSDKAMLLFLKENEWHELSLLFFHYLARQQGIRTVYLGGNVPLADLRELSLRCSFSWVVSSFTNAISPEELHDYLSEISQLFPEGKIFISGMQVRLQQAQITEKIIQVRTPVDFTSHLSA